MPAVTPVKGKWGSRSVVYLVDGYDMTASDPQSLRCKVIVETENTDGLGDSWREHSPTGIRTAELAQDGAFFRTDAANGHIALKDLSPDPQAAKRIAVVGFCGNTVGQPFTAFEGLVQSEYEVLSERGKLQRANAAFGVSGKAEDGIIVHALGAETADANTEATSVDNTKAPQRVVAIQSSSVANPTVITTATPHGLTTGETVLISGHTSTPSINGEQPVTVVSTTTFTVPVNVTVGGGANGTFVKGKTVAGGTGYLEMTALTLGGHTGALYTFRHSDDDAIFVDLLAMTTRTLFGAERKTVAGTVRRYIAGAMDFTGAGSPTSTFLAGFARS